MKEKLKNALIRGATWGFGIGIIYILLFGSMNAEASGKVDLGGRLDNDDLYIVTSLDYSWEAGKFERDIEFDYRYQDKDDITNTNKGLIEFKQRLKFKPKHYAFGLIRYDYNEFRPINHRRQVNVGWGYKIIRSEKIKMSNEFAVGYLNSEMDVGSHSVNEVLFRNSLWVFYQIYPRLNDK